MSKYIVLYATLIGVDFCEEGDIIELPDGTDRNFIARMQTIGAIAPYEGKNDVAPSNKDAKNDAKENKKLASDKSKEAKKDDKKPPEDDEDANAKGFDENGNIND